MGLIQLGSTEQQWNVKTLVCYLGAQEKPKYLRVNQSREACGQECSHRLMITEQVELRLSQLFSRMDKVFIKGTMFISVYVIMERLALTED